MTSDATNTLTTQRRAQLIRSSTKLSKVLGCTPHISSRLPLPQVALHSRSSSQSLSSTFWSRPSSPQSSCTTSIRSKRSLNLGLRPTAPVRQANDVWPASLPSRRVRSPLVDLTLQSIPASPASPSFSEHADSPDADDNEDLSYTFKIPSVSSTRKAKMDRLRKRLGDGVPLDMVFPDIADYDLPQVQETTTPTHDVHDDKSTIETPVTPTFRIKRVPVPAYSPARGLRTTHSFSTARSLGPIIESTDEHGASCGEEFQFLTRSLSSPTLRERSPPPSYESIASPSPAASLPSEGNHAQGWFESESEFNETNMTRSESSDSVYSSPVTEHDGENESTTPENIQIATNAVHLPISQWFAEVEKELNNDRGRQSADFFFNWASKNARPADWAPPTPRTRPAAYARKDSLTLYPTSRRRLTADSLEEKFLTELAPAGTCH